MTEELDYFKEKYNEMKELLNTCKEQLSQFEDLNLMRNDVIEKLEKENSLLKTIVKQQTSSIATSASSTVNTCRTVLVADQ
jgi:hypothetical protein